MADSQLPSLHAYSEAFVTVSFLDRYRKYLWCDTDDDADPFAESEDKEELENDENCTRLLLASSYVSIYNFFDGMVWSHARVIY